MLRLAPVLLQCAGWLCGCAMFAGLGGPAGAQQTLITVQTTRPRQVFQGLGAGAIYYEGHITSLAERKNDKRQQELYDDMFARVPTRYLQLMIRETHEPENDNADPYTPAFNDKNFDYCRHTLQIARAALKRQKDIQLYATLYTPPPWMKTNNAASGGGEARATLKRGLELELAEYVWAFLEHMQRNGAPIQYLSIANEPDWPHTQPGYCLTPERNAALFKAVGEYLDKMAVKYPKVPRVKLVGPNTLSAPGAVKDYVPRLLTTAGRYLDVVASHDYDVRGDRWGALRRLAGKRPVWVTEWCARKKDSSPGMINSAIEYGQAMHEAFKGGANVWMAYDWAYPPRDSGEALIHIDWGKDYRLTKAYHLFRQWSVPLTPGMRVVEVGVLGPGASGDGKPGVKPTAFLATDNRTLVVHVVNAQDREASIALRLTGKWSTPAKATRTRTSATEDVAALEDLTKSTTSFADTLPARSMVTYRFSSGGK
jgi:O-glycosyl hydrolase